MSAPKRIGRILPEKNSSGFVMSNGISGLATEAPLEIEINGVHVASLICTSHSREELVIGWCFNQGFIDSRRDVSRMLVTHERASLMLGRALPGGHDWKEQLIAGFDGGMVRTPGKYRTTPPERDGFTIDSQFFIALVSELSLRFRMKHGDEYLRHAGASNGTDVMISANDTSRHNAFDKLSGWAVMSERTLDDLVVLHQGITTASIAHKATRAGVKILATDAMPTVQAVKMAQGAGIALIGNVFRDERVIFTHPWRVHRPAR